MGHAVDHWLGKNGSGTFSMAYAELAGAGFREDNMGRWSWDARAGFCYREYGCYTGGPREAWADAFAAYVMHETWDINPTSIDGTFLSRGSWAWQNMYDAVSTTMMTNIIN